MNVPVVVAILTSLRFCICLSAICHVATSQRSNYARNACGDVGVASVRKVVMLSNVVGYENVVIGKD